jgi:hypothetical protein
MLETIARKPALEAATNGARRGRLVAKQDGMKSRGKTRGQVGALLVGAGLIISCVSAGNRSSTTTSAAAGMAGSGERPWVAERRARKAKRAKEEGVPPTPPSITAVEVAATLAPDELMSVAVLLEEVPSALPKDRPPTQQESINENHRQLRVLAPVRARVVAELEKLGGVNIRLLEMTSDIFVYLPAKSVPLAGKIPGVRAVLPDVELTPG